MLTFANGGSFSVSPTLDIPVQLALRSPFNPAYPAAFPPSSALCKASARIYLLSLIGLLYFITVLLCCQALNEKNSICAVKEKAPEGRRFYRNAEGLRLKRASLRITLSGQAVPFAWSHLLCRHDQHHRPAQFIRHAGRRFDHLLRRLRLFYMPQGKAV